MPELALPVLAVGILGGLIAAGVLHELTHAAAARLLGARVHDIDLINMHVTWEIDARASLWRDRVINLAPQLVGLTVALLVLATGVDVLTRSFVPVVVAWAWYTLGGGMADYRLAVARGDGWWWWRQSRARRRALLAAALTYGGILGLALATTPTRLTIVIRTFAMASVLAGLVMLPVTLETPQRSPA